MSLQGKVALVTGASRGIGAAIARALGQGGATVVGTATTVAGAEAITERFSQEGITGSGKVLDVTDGQSVITLVKAISDEYGAPTVLINNAGVTRDNLLLRMKDDEWDTVIATNLGAAYRVTKACLRGMMKARWGRIINVSSVVGSMGNPGQANYAATKAGVEGFARALASEVGARGITVNAVAPGFIDTDMTRALPDEQRAVLLGQIPVGRLGQVDEIASVVLFLAGDGAAYITGETIQVNGGMYMG